MSSGIVTYQLVKLVLRVKESNNVTREGEEVTNGFEIGFGFRFEIGC